jgi:glycosyltransferase involved in cell wall biosynthesis
VKILLVNDYATAAYGSENLTLRLRDLLRQRGHDARLFASCARAVDEQEVLADYQCFGTRSRFNRLLQVVNPWAFWEFRRVLREFRPAVVHVKIFLLQISPLILPLLRNVPSLYDATVLRSICPTGIKMLPDGGVCHVPAGTVCYHNRCFLLRSLLPAMLGMWFWKKWRNAFDLIITNSHAMRFRLNSEGVEVKHVIWHGIPTRPQRPPLSSPPTVAFAGRLALEKGADVLVKAFARTSQEITDARLILAGDGLERKRLKNLIADLGLSSRVSMTGHILQPEVERLFDAAWVQAVPSRCVESFGMVAAEAMMRGTAVVASASGGLVEIVGEDGQRGLLVPPGDDKALAGALLSLLRNRQLAEKMGRAGREFALVRFNEETYVDETLRLYEKICL